MIRQAHSIFQPQLFADRSPAPANTDAPATTPTASPSDAGKSVVQKLLKLRKTMTADELDFLPDVNAAIESIRAKLRSTEPQRFETVLYAVEQSGATTITEIAEDTRLAPKAVKQIVDELIERGTLYNAARYIPGNARPRFMIKSNRVKTPEVI